MSSGITEYAGALEWSYVSMSGGIASSNVLVPPNLQDVRYGTNVQVYTVFHDQNLTIASQALYI